jgi:phosphoglycolate phosphatase
MKQNLIILWDWNGTIFDDLSISLESVNLLLDSYNKPRITKELYYSYMDTPISKFYERLFNFDVIPFSLLGQQFHENYALLSKNAGLSEGIMETVKKLHSIGLPQYIASASHKNKIIPKAKELGILQFMEDVIGADNYNASDKIERTINYFKDHNISLENCIVIGDSLHDLEMANRLKAKCILLSTGHEGRQKLEKNGGVVIDYISSDVILSHCI